MATWSTNSEGSFFCSSSRLDIKSAWSCLPGHQGWPREDACKSKPKIRRRNTFLKKWSEEAAKKTILQWYSCEMKALQKLFNLKKKHKYTYI